MVNESIDFEIEFDDSPGAMGLLNALRSSAHELVFARDMDNGSELDESAFIAWRDSKGKRASFVQCMLGDVLIGELRLRSLLVGAIDREHGADLELNFAMSDVREQQWGIATRELFRFGELAARRFGARDYRAGSENIMSEKETLFHGRRLGGMWIGSSGVRFERPPWWYRTLAALTW